MIFRVVVGVCLVVKMTIALWGDHYKGTEAKTQVGSKPTPSSPIKTLPQHKYGGLLASKDKITNYPHVITNALRVKANYQRDY